MKKCRRCKGKGVVIVQHQLGPGFVQQMQQECDSCGGQGKTIAKKCSRCDGQKVIHGTDTITIDIEKGMADGQEILFPRAGDQDADMTISPGDVIYTIRTAPHKLFSRRGNDLYMSQAITLAEALTGFKKTFKHLDGHEVTLKRAKVTQPGFVMKVADEGMPTFEMSSEIGDLYVAITVVIPTTLSKDVRQQAADLLGGGAAHSEL